jgi:hypothetical protein
MLAYSMDDSCQKCWERGRKPIPGKNIAKYQKSGVRRGSQEVFTDASRARRTREEILMEGKLQGDYYSKKESGRETS